MNDVSAAGDGPPQRRVEVAAPPADAPVAGPEPMAAGEAETPGAPLDMPPVTVLGGPPDTPVGSGERPARRRPGVRTTGRQPDVAGALPAKSGGRRRAGIAIATATGVVALAAAPFAVVSPPVRILGDSASSAAKERPKTEAKKQAEHKPAVPVPVPVPSWQGRHPSPPVPARPPRVNLPPSSAPPADDAAPADAQRPKSGEQKDHQAKAQPRTPVRSPDRARTSRTRTTNRALSANAAEHHATVRTEAAKTPGRTSKSRSAPASGRAANEKTGAPARTRVVHGTYVLRPGQTVGNNRIRLTLRSDGDLVLRNRDGKVVWSTGTHASGTRAVFQADGNFVVYSSDDATLWSSRTDGHDGAVLVLQSDGNLTIRQGDTTLWATGT